MKNERIAQFAEELRTTDKRQGYGFLHVEDAGGHHYCTVGVGMELARIDQEPTNGNGWPAPGSRRVWMFGENDEKHYASREFVEWLGFEVPERGHAPILVLGDGYEDEHGDTISLYDLNDDRNLSFKEIADLIDHYGLEVR
jgi:hypothetical protein